MRVSIIADDNRIVIDGKSHSVDCSILPKNIHAIQWEDMEGEIEFRSDEKGDRAPNVLISDFTPFQPLVDAWKIEDAKPPPPPQVDTFPSPPPSVRSQDLLAQFTSTDIIAIQAAISSNPQMLLLWYSLLAQQDSMLIENVRFKSGWAALIQVLGQDRMNTIATALGVTVV